MKTFLIFFMAISTSLSAQEAKKKPAAKKPPAAHSKATPEQIRKFNQLEKKQQKK